MVRILAKGGILTPSYLLNILAIAKSSGNKHVMFGSRQDILFEVSIKQMPKVREAFDGLQLNYIVHGIKESRAQNIVSSYVSSDMTAATPWLSSGNYLYVLEHFDYQPTLRVNIVDPKQSLVPLFYGHLNFIASSVKDYWYLYIRKDEKQVPERWPLLVLSGDMAILSKKIEEAWKTLNTGTISDLFDYVKDSLTYNWRKIETSLELDFTAPHDYEGFGKMHSSQNHWAGFYWRNNAYDISFLEQVCHLCLRTNISKICLTPWKSFLVKEIKGNDLIHWHRLLGRFGINMRHSSFELNWHLPVNDRSALRLKRYLVKEFDKQDVCVHGLTFGIKTKPEPSFTSIIVERIPGLKFLKQFDPFVRYYVYHARNFNANSCIYEEYMPDMPIYRLPEVLQKLTLKFYAQWLPTNEKQGSPSQTEHVDKHVVYQCKQCLSIYNDQVGDPFRGIEKNTSFEKLSPSFCCSLCEAPKTDFKAVLLNKLINEANV